MADTSTPFTPRELKARCVLSAIYLPDASFLSGVFARDNVQDDADNLLSQTLYYSIDNPDYQTAPPQAQRLQSVSQSSGGLMPLANSKIGAPMCTFVYGGIKPSTVHSQLNLIQGPASSIIGVNQLTYNPTFTRDANLGGRQGTDPNDTANYASQTFNYLGAQNPTIPSANVPPFTSANPVPRTTFNIWQVANYAASDMQLFDIIGDLGLVASSTASADSLRKLGVARQNITSDGRCEISVNSAPNKEVLMLRMFPISYDLAYMSFPLDEKENPQQIDSGPANLYYPYDAFAEQQAVATTYRPINAIGTKNCGFQMHFTVAQMNDIRHPTNGELNSSIEIEFGQPDVTPPMNGPIQPIIERFKIKLIPDQRPSLLFYHPAKGDFDEIKLKAPIFCQSSKGSSYSIFVHFAGPTMMIGFNTDVKSWNCIMPIKGDRAVDDLNKYYYPVIPWNAFIQATFKGVQASFEYGPIAFNNYNGENVTGTGNDVDIQDLSYVTSNYQVPLAAQNSITVDALNKYLTANVYNPATNETVDPIRTGVTYYPDWRLMYSLSTSPQISYYGASQQITGENNIKYYQTNGKLLYNTTIEGPQFLKLRNDLLTDIKPTLSKSFDKWSDLTFALKNFNITFNLDGTNRSYLSGTADVILENLETDVIGHLASIAMRQNQFIITLQAGYDEFHTFFQGAILTVEVTTKLDGETSTRLHLKDIGSHLLDNIHFNQNFYFVGSTYDRILTDVFAIGGLQNYLFIQQDPIVDDGSGNFSNFTDAIQQALGPQNIENSIVSQVVHGTVDKSLMQVVKPTLELVRKNLGFGTLKFNFDLEQFDLVWRLDPFFLDSLVVLGVPDDNGNFTIPGDLDFHGVLAGDFTESVVVDDLHAAFAVKSTDWVGLPLFDYRINSKAFDATTLATLNDAIKNGQSFDDFGYVGFRKFFVDTAMSGNLLDDISLHKAADLYEDILFHTNERISLEVYVTRPLNIWGQFTVQTFEDTTDPTSASDPYFYKEVTYRYEKGPKPITASIKGERFSLSKFSE